VLTRRQLLALSGGWAWSLSAFAGQHAGMTRTSAPPPQSFDGDADITLRIAETSVELAPRRGVRTLAYNGRVPGPLLRVRRGTPLTVDVWNDTGAPDIVHWHGFHIPPDVDGAYEEGTPGVPPHGRRRYVFTPEPSGTRWYHSHEFAGRNLKKGTYTGQFGLVVVEGDDAGAYDLEVPILLHEWEPRFTASAAMDVEFRAFSVNGRMLGAGEPIRVRPSQRVLFRIVNASATLHHRLALPRHLFHVVALDGNRVSTPRSVPAIELGPGERIDAIVEMNQPGAWILGSTRAPYRTAGLGIVVEYADRSDQPAWEPPSAAPWQYQAFGASASAGEPDGRLTLAFRAVGDGHHWTINGKSYPKTDPIVVSANRRYRWTLDNQSADAHPVHLHRHRFEVVRVDGVPMSGVWKDVVVVPAWKQVEIDVPTTQPGLSLFHCHQQFHMDNGFMALLRYE